MKRKVFYVLLSLCLLAFAAAVIIHPERYVKCCFAGFSIWAESVLPSLFPFMVVTLIFVKTGVAEKAALPLSRAADKLKFPPAAAACFVLSLCSGYPAGSRVVGEFCERGAIRRSEAARCAYLCSTSGPLFIIGSVGFKMFGDKTAGVKILIAHVLSVLIISLIIALCGKKSASAPVKRAKYGGNALYDAFYGAVVAVTVAGGFIAFFYVVAAFCADFNLFYPLEKALGFILDENLASAVCLGRVEANTGCIELSKAGGKLAVALAGFSITFGGLSILLQQLSYLTKFGVNPLKFTCVKFLQGALCFALLLI